MSWWLGCSGRCRARRCSRKPKPRRLRSEAGPNSEALGVISKFFIERPVLANVIALVTVLIGVVAIFGLPVSQYPNVVPPTIAVTARYPGASAQSVIDTVALPIEQQVNGVPGMLYMQST